MNRYFSSFAIAGFIYTLGGSIIFYLFVFNIDYKLKQNKNKVNKISFSIIQQVKKVPKPIVKPKKQIVQKKEPPKIVKKVIPKKVVKKKIKPTPIKKKIKKVVKVEKKVMPIKKEIVKEIKKVEKPKIDNTRILAAKKKRLDELRALEKLRKKELFLKNITKRINENKSYPRIARKGNIQGHVKVSFIISPHGELLSYQILNGKKIFHKSIAKALEKSFPFPIDKDILNSNLTINLEIVYQLI